MVQSQRLQSHPIRRAGHRPSLFLGGDRELVLFTGLVASALVWTGHPFAMVFGASLWLVTLHLLRLMARADPWMRGVYLRHRHYKDFYPARSTPYRTH